MPDRIVREVTLKTLQAAEALTDQADVLRDLGVDHLSQVRTADVLASDAVAANVQAWAKGTAAALGAWDFAGPFAIAPSLVSLFTLSFRTIKKIGLCYGFETNTPAEEIIVLEVFAAASSLYHRDKVRAIHAIDELVAQVHFADIREEQVVAAVRKISRAVGYNLTRRRALANLPALGAIVGGSTNVWLLRDVSWAARNLYARRRLNENR